MHEYARPVVTLLSNIHLTDISWRHMAAATVLLCGAVLTEEGYQKLTRFDRAARPDRSDRARRHPNMPGSRRR